MEWGVLIRATFDYLDMSFADHRKSEQKEAEKLSYSAIMHQKITSMVEKAEKALEDGDHKASIAILSRALALDPTDPRLFKMRADAYVRLGDFPSAIANYKKTVFLSSSKAPGLTLTMADTHYRNGERCVSEGNVKAALDAFSLASQLRPNEREYTMQRINCLLSLRRYNECLKMVQEEIKHSDPTPQLYLIHAKISLIFEKNTEVYNCLTRALELDPAYQEAIEMKEQREVEARKLQSQAVKFLLLGQRDGALSKISTAIECDPREPEFHVLRGAIYRQNSDYARAVEELLTAIDKSGDKTSTVYSASCRQLVLTYNDFAVVCFRRKKYDEAIQLLNKALADEKMEGGLYVNRGDCFYHQNNLYFALADYCRAQHISPNDYHIRNRVAITQCELGVKEFRGGNFSEAEKLFSAAIGNNPTVGHFYLCRARVNYELKQTDAAREDILRVLILEPECDTCLPLIARLFPGKTQTDLLNSPKLTPISAKLTQAINEHDKSATRENLLDSVEEKVEWELQELFTQLKLLEGFSSPALEVEGGASSSSLITPVLASHTLPTTTAPHALSLTQLPNTTITHREPPLLPRQWPVLSLALPPAEALSSPRETEDGLSVLPDRVACEVEREFHTQLYYSKKDLWITRVSCAAKEHDINYSRFMHGLVRCDIQLNRKVLSELAIHEPRTFQALTEIARRRLNDGLLGVLEDDVTGETDQSECSRSRPPPSTSHPSPSQTWIPYVTKEVTVGNRKVMETAV